MSDTRPQGQPDEAMLDLAVKQVTEGLSPAEQRALDVMDRAVSSANWVGMERAAAAIVLAGSAHAAPLPPDLAQRVARQAVLHFGAAAKTAGTGTSGDNLVGLAAA